jgi:hypothetical protein
MNVTAGLIAADPFGITGAGRDFTVDAHCVFDGDKRPSGRDEF